MQGRRYQSAVERLLDLSVPYAYGRMENGALYGLTSGTPDRPFVKRPRMVWRLPFEGGYLAGNCAALVTINSMKEYVHQQIKSENAKRHEYGKRHGSLNGYGTRRCF
jgi:hypothetical protein